ncbi:hypothetical protein ACJX0J_026199 [Zea mays]
MYVFGAPETGKHSQTDGVLRTGVWHALSINEQEKSSHSNMHLTIGLYFQGLLSDNLVSLSIPIHAIIVLINFLRKKDFHNIGNFIQYPDGTHIDILCACIIYYRKIMKSNLGPTLLGNQEK